MPNTSVSLSVTSADNSPKEKKITRSLRSKKSPTRVEDPLPPASVPAERVKFATGTIPRFKDTCRLTNDPYSKECYMFSADDSEAPEAHFYRCDTTNMRWTNLTHRLTYRIPHAPFSEEELEPKTRQLPRISHAGICFLHFRDTSFIVIFGGYDHHTASPSSDMIVINLKNLGWWIVRLEDDDGKKEEVIPRISPEIVAIDKTIYIFGGYRQFGDNPRPCTSFSVAKYAEDEGRWKWTAKDKPYPAPVPSGKIFGSVCSAYNGKKILLGPGRLTDNNPINIAKDDLFFFDTTQHKFQPAIVNLKGSLPQDIAWYFLLEPHIWTPRTSANQAQPSSTVSSPEPPPIFMCASIPVANTEDSAPEIWQLSFSKKRIDCLHVSRMTWDIDTELEECLFIASPGPRIRFIGTKEPPAAGKKRRRTRVIDSDDDETSSVDSEPNDACNNATWNAYFDIPLFV
ncbi:hypothetical protein HYPSUDRAFT_214963 [Hypholoma sublateritium FD-334 SS-4]|uniref:Uncharacterized protein n=1 Tax=Hypholoma sublateritium (strain FD-334 SS-4) TaxID=945553 RepID=A0A0D2PWT2_HYPSF|nr:hypothetical protein HYPSUDRAFT_214963 [Hypholoma sublateritium FD-334 SS-4]